MFTKIKDGIQIGIGIVIVLAISGITYASYNALTAVESGDSLTKDSWNQMIINQTDFDTRLNNVVDNDYVTSTNIIDDGSGNIGIGTASPIEKLDVDGHIIGTPIMGNWHPNGTHGPSASGYTNIIFAADFDVTDSSYFTNLGGSNGIRIEKSGYYHIEMRTLVHLGGAGGYGHLYLMKNGISIDIDHGSSAATATWEDRHTSWKGFVNSGDIISSKVNHTIPSTYAYDGTSNYTKLTIEKLN